MGFFGESRTVGFFGDVDRDLLADKPCDLLADKPCDLLGDKALGDRDLLGDRRLGDRGDWRLGESGGPGAVALALLGACRLGATSLINDSHLSSSLGSDILRPTLPSCPELLTALLRSAPELVSNSNFRTALGGLLTALRLRSEELRARPNLGWSRSVLWTDLPPLDSSGSVL